MESNEQSSAGASSSSLPSPPDPPKTTNNWRYRSGKEARLSLDKEVLLFNLRQFNQQWLLEEEERIEQEKKVLIFNLHQLNQQRMLKEEESIEQKFSEDLARLPPDTASDEEASSGHEGGDENSSPLSSVFDPGMPSPPPSSTLGSVPNTPPRPGPTNSIIGGAIYLHQFSRTPVVPSLCPYCLKVETWLRLTGLKYRNVDHKMKFKSTKGRLPFVALNGEEFADSGMILTKLAHHFVVDPDAQLTKEERNSSHALISMIENHLCWVHVYWRSKNPDAMIKGFKLSLQHTLGSRIPNGLLNIFFKLTYSRKGAKKVKAHGLGGPTAEEIFEFGKRDLKILEEALGDGKFFFGENPSNLDVVAFANLVQIFCVDKCVDYDLRDWMGENCPGLVGLVTRMKERCFPDWDQIGSTLGMNTHIPEPEKKEEEVKEPEKEPLVKATAAEEEKKEEVKKEEAEK